jgi:hypothetical protein
MKFEARVARDESVVPPRIDPHEIEADHAADSVMSGKSAAIQDQHSLSMREPARDSDLIPGEGESLDSTARSVMESRLGHDFSRVRVHADSRAATAARKENAEAYTYGRHVIFGAGKYKPRTADGQRLLAHELTHVVQQTRRGGRASPVVQRKDAGGLTATVIDHGASEDAVKIAKARMNEVLGNLKDPAAGELKGATVELHIIPHDKKLTDLSEFASLKGTKTFDGRNYDELRGVGATKIKDTIRYAIAEEQLVKIKDKPSQYELGFVGAHESGHVVEQFGLNKEQQKSLKDAYDERKKAGGPWLSPDWYTSSGTGEYFAQSTSAYFGRPYSSSEEDKKTYTRDWLKKNDAAMTKLLTTVYG